MINLKFLKKAGTSTKNHFPILAQLSILGVILLIIFSAVFYSPNTSNTDSASDVPDQISDSDLPLVPQKIEGDLTLKAKGVYVWDVRAQRTLYAKNPDQSLPLASITKLMTSLLAHELISENESVTIPRSAVNQEGSRGLSLGENFAIETLQKMALVASYNDAAYTLASSVGSLLGDGDPTAQFIAGMNIRAKELGLESLKFNNTTGLDISAVEPGAQGNARDVTFLMEYMIKNYPETVAVTQLPTTRAYNEAGEYHDIENTNDIVNRIPNLIASKTGYTDLAGGNLTVAFDIGYNHPIIITVLGSTRSERFTDVLTLVKAVKATVQE